MYRVDRSIGGTSSVEDIDSDSTVLSNDPLTIVDGHATMMADVDDFLAKGSSTAAASEEFPLIPRRVINKIAKRFKRDRRTKDYKTIAPVPATNPSQAENNVDPRGIKDRHEAERARRAALKLRTDEILRPIKKELDRRRRAERRKIDNVVIQVSDGWNTKSFADYRERHVRDRGHDDKLRRELERHRNDVLSSSPYR